jgi:hypothetical protein
MKISDVTANIILPISKVGVKKMATVISENFIPVHSLTPNANQTQTEITLHKTKNKYNLIRK